MPSRVTILHYAALADTPTKRAVAVIRVSKVGKREAEKFISPEDQLKLIDQVCVQHHFQIVQIYHEMDQSGYRTRFEKRKGLFPATKMIETGQADVVVMGFFDRMARNIVVQTEFLGRVGRAGGEVWAHDWGRIQTDSAVALLAAGMMGLVTQYMAQSVAEKTQGPKERAISLGIPTFPHIPPGYRLEDRRLVIVEDEATLVKEAFDRRARGDSYHVIRDWLRSKGLVRSTRGVQELLKNRIYLGELHFGRPKVKGGSGELANLKSHKAIVNREVFERVTGMRGIKGERGSTESIHARLLSRQAVLRCAACRRALIVGAHPSHGKTWITYRCPPMGDCTERPSILADKVDGYVGEWMKQVQAQGRFSAAKQMVTAQAELTHAEEDLQQAMRNLATFKDTAQAQKILEEFRVKTEVARSHVNDLRRAFGPSAVLSMADWDTLTLAGRRDLVRVLIKRIEVRRGRGPVEERVTIVESFE